jgi:hypothetical protein
MDEVATRSVPSRGVGAVKPPKRYMRNLKALITAIALIGSFVAASAAGQIAVTSRAAAATGLVADGGPPGQSYYCGLGSVVAASRLCSDPSFFPIATWDQTPASTDSNGGNSPDLPSQGFANEAAAGAYAGINTWIGDYNGMAADAANGADNLQAATAQGQYAIYDDPQSLQPGGADASYWASTTPAEKSALIGYQLGDEAACGNPSEPVNQVPIVQAAKAADPSRLTQDGEGSGAIDPGLIGGGSSCVSQYEANFNAPDITSADYYALTDQYHGVVCSSDCLHEYGDFAQASRAWNQDKKPFWEDVETGDNYYGGSNFIPATSGSQYPQQEATVEQVNSAAWDSIINGARGIIWFCHQFAPDTQTNSSQYAVGAGDDGPDYGWCLDNKPARDNLRYVDSGIQSFAPVLNSPWISSGFSNSSSNPAVPMAEMVKQYEGATYIFAMTDRSGSTTATFSTPSLAGQSASVIYDSNAKYDPSANETGKTVGIDSSGTFSDVYPGNQSDVTAPSNYSVRVYKVGGIGGAIGAPPAVSGISPSSGSAAGGTTVTVSGSDLGGATGVEFGSNPGSITSSSASSLTVTSPPGIFGSTVDVRVVTPGGESPAVAADRFTYSAKGDYHPVAPFRIADTRGGSRRPLAGGTLGPGGQIDIPVAGTDGVPPDATAAVVNLTATDVTSSTYLTAWPTGTARPFVSNVNAVAGQTVPNLVEVALGSGGKLSVYNDQGQADVVADLEGWVGPETSQEGLYRPLDPARLVDTRAGSGEADAGRPLGPGATLSLDVVGKAGVPTTGVSAVVLDVTSTNSTLSSFVTAWPDGSSRPTASNLNFTPGENVSNRVIVPVGADGKVDFYNSQGTSDLVVDLNGYFSGSGSQFAPASPVRIADTRPSSGRPYSGDTIGPHGLLRIQVAGTDVVPEGATAVVANVTATDASSDTFLTVYPDGSQLPPTSDINVAAGATVPNLAVLKLGSDGAIDVYNDSGIANVVIDVAGWYG